MAQNEISVFQRTVWAHYKKRGRHDLPWRATRDPYQILVSEMMLQQTQVERVIPFFISFVKRFPTARSLARAPLADALRAWQGLGYNRRAKHLHEAAEEIVKDGFPHTVEGIDHLPGVGSYTARAVAAFAFNTDCLVLETNIRTAVTHHFFAGARKISDEQILQILAHALPQGRAREWYSALMDYGAYLKQSGVRLNTKSTHYARQSQFKGSLREARGAILRELAKGERGEKALENLLGAARRAQMDRALEALRIEQLIQKRGRAYALPR